MIEQSKQGFWTITGDTHVGKWACEEKRLDHDQYMLNIIRPYIKDGDTVIDAGAFIGDHTVAYLNWVGESGRVIAFEPGEEAFQCLELNCPKADNHRVALSYVKTIYKINPLENAGASYLSEVKVPDTLSTETSKLIYAKPLDSYNLNPNYIKLDLEGFEYKALIGAKETIARSKPTMYIEINEGALQRQGNTKEQIFSLLEEYNYYWRIAQVGCTRDSDQFDILCQSKELVHALHSN